MPLLIGLAVPATLAERSKSAGPTMVRVYIVEVYLSNSEINCNNLPFHLGEHM